MIMTTESAYAAIDEAALRIAATGAADWLDALDRNDTENDEDDEDIGFYISRYNSCWRRLTGVRPHHVEFLGRQWTAEIRGDQTIWEMLPA